VDFTILIIIGLSFSLILLIKRLSNSQFALLSEVSSFIIIAIITVELFYGWLVGSHYYFNVPFLLRLNSPLVFLIGPSIYFLVYSHLHPTVKLKSISILHLLPFIAVIFYFLPTYFSSNAEKLAYLDSMYTKLSFDSIFIGGLRRIHQMTYLIASLFIVRKARMLKSKMKISPSIYIILIVFTLLLLFDIYRYFFQFDLKTGIIDVVILSIIAIYLVFNQLGNPKSIKLVTSIEQNQLTKYSNQIVQAITHNKIYLNPKISLNDLAEISSLQKHIVSQVINHSLNSNFNEFINKYRVDEAIQLLENPETNNLTIKAISEMAGFNTVSSFNANFKKFTGKSPKEFRA